MKVRQYLVIGAGRFGTAVSTTLHASGHEVVVVDRNEDLIESIMHRVTYAVIADATDEGALRSLGVRNFDAVVVAIGVNFQANVLATTLLKSMGAKHVVSKAADKLTAEVLMRVGADRVVRPEHDMGVQLAKQFAEPTVLDAFDFGAEHEVVEMIAQKPLEGSLRSLELSGRFRIHVIAVERHNQVELNPTADYEIRPGDKLVLIGSRESLNRLRSWLD